MRRSGWFALAAGGMAVTIGIAAAYHARGAESDRGAAAPISVIVATSRSADVDIYLSGLGTVTASNTVTVKSRVDGQLLSLAFREGQLVKAGDVLAQLDPRP